MIRAVIFDMDGVLVDAREWHYESLNRALALFGQHINRYEHLSAYDGLPTRRKLEMLSVERGLPRALHGFLNGLKQQYTLELVATSCRPVFQHEYALSRLRSDGLRLGVASNSVAASVSAMMRCSRLVDYLDVLVSNEDVARAKPAPDVYLHAMSLLGVTPRETLVVEDNENGIKAAQAAGAHLLVVGDPSDVTYSALRKRIDAVESDAVNPREPADEPLRYARNGTSQ